MAILLLATIIAAADIDAISIARLMFFGDSLA
jgi:hypothetical protein